VRIGEKSRIPVMNFVTPTHVLIAAQYQQSSATPYVTLILILAVVCIVLGLIGRYIGSFKGRAKEGFWIGFFLGPIGWIIVALLPPPVEVEARRATQISSLAQGRTTSTRPCPWCAEEIRPAAIVCRFCGRDVEPIEPSIRHSEPSFPTSDEEVSQPSTQLTWLKYRMRGLLGSRGPDS